MNSTVEKYGPKIGEAEFRRLAMSGYTRRQLQCEFGVSHQAISQRAAKLGLVDVLNANRLAKHGRGQTLHEVKYEFPLDRVRVLRAQGAMAAYRCQRGNARRRGIAWEMTFREWWEVWEASGKWGVRGRSKGGWVMGRRGDVGPYKVGNVYICDHSENAQVRSSRKGGKS